MSLNKENSKYQIQNPNSNNGIIKQDQMADGYSYELYFGGIVRQSLFDRFRVRGTIEYGNVIRNGRLCQRYGCWIPIDIGMEIMDDFPAKTID